MSKPMMKALTIALLIGLPLTNTALEAWQTKAVSVEFLVIDGWGNPAPGKARISIARVGEATPSDILDYPDVKQVRLRGGEYRVLVEAQGFLRRPQQVLVGDEDLLVPLQIVLAPVEGTGISAVPVSGRLGEKFKNDPVPLWVRIVGVYNNVDRIAKANEDRAFVFQGVPLGRYVLFILSRGALKEQRTLDVGPFPPTVVDVQ